MITKISRDWDGFQKQMREQRWLDDQFDLRSHWKVNEIGSDVYRDSKIVEYKQDIEDVFPEIQKDGKIVMKKFRRGEEIVQFEQDRIRNVDLPDNRAFIDMGLNISKNPWVDNEGGEAATAGKVRHMDSVDFRERCVPMNGRLYALYLKGKSDFQPPRHLRQEVLFETIPAIDRVQADKLTKFFRKTDARKDVVKGLVNGYYNMPEGFKVWNEDELKEQIEEFDIMESVLERIPEEGENNERTLEDERIFYYEVSNKMIEKGYCTQFSSVLQQINYIERAARQAYKNWLRDGEPNLDMLATQVEVEVDDIMNEEEEYIDKKEEPVVNLGEFGAFPLYYEDDGLLTEYINDIKEADVKELRAMQRDMFPTYNEYTGKESRAVLYYLTDMQKSVFWSFIAGRKQELIKQIIKTAPEHILRVVEFILKNGKTTAVRALILAMGRGEAFSIDDTVFEGKPSDDEYWMMWEAYKQAGKKKKQLKF
jgi:hypothetical protein